MKVLIFGKEKNVIEPLVRKSGLEIVETKPDVIISYGGDGTLMRAENMYPGIPKVVLKGTLVCKKCPPLSNKDILDHLVKGKYEIEELYKVSVKAKGKELHAVNDIVLHNMDARQGIRYNIHVNGSVVGNEVIGDGIVVATPFGSTAYYRSITDSFFDVGIGIAFNNSTEQMDHMVISEKSKINVEITRGPAIIYADNQKESIKMKAGDKAIIGKSNKILKVIKMGL